MRAWLLILYPETEISADPQVFDPRAQYLSTHGLLSLPMDSLPNKAFLGLLETPEIDFEVTHDTLGPGITSFTVRNPRGERPLASWRDLYFYGRAWAAYSAPVSSSASFDDYQLVARGVVENLVWKDSDDLVEILVTDARAALDVDLSLPRYKGLGDVLRFEIGDTIDLGTVPLPSKWTWHVWLRLHPGDLAAMQAQFPVQGLIIRADAATDGYRVQLNWNGSGSIRAWFLELTPNFLESPSVLQEDGEWHAFSMSGGDGSIRMYYDGNLVAETGVSGSMTAPDRTLTFGTGCALDATAWCLESTIASAERIREVAASPPDPQGSDVVALWRDIAPPDQLVNAAGNEYHGTRTGTSVIYGDEGWYDQADITRPCALGEAGGVPGHLVDPTRWIFDIHFQRYGGVVRALHRGLEMATPANYEVQPEKGTVELRALIGDVGGVRFRIHGEDDGTTAPSSLPEIVQFLITWLGPKKADGSPRFTASDFGDSFQNYDLDHMPLGLWIGAGQAPRLLQLLDELCQPMETRLVQDLLGKWQLVYLGPPTSPLGELRHGIHFDVIEDLEGSGPPTSAQSVQYDRNHGVQRDGDLSPSAATVDQSWALNEWRRRRISAPAGQVGRVGGVEGLPVPSSLVRGADAEELARLRQAGWHGAEGRQRIRLELLQDLRILPGEVWTVVAEPVISSTAGRDFRVTRYTSDDGPFGSVELWGLPGGSP